MAIWDDAWDAAKDAAEKVGEALSDAADEIGGAAEDAGEALGDAAKGVGDAVEDIFGAAEKAVEGLGNIVVEGAFKMSEGIGEGLNWVGENAGDDIASWIKDTLEDYSGEIAAGAAAAATAVVTGIFGGGSADQGTGKTAESGELPPVASTEPVGDSVGQALTVAPYSEYVGTGLMRSSQETDWVGEAIRKAVNDLDPVIDPVPASSSSSPPYHEYVDPSLMTASPDIWLH